MTTHNPLRILSILALLLLILTGCQAQQHVRDADRYMLLRDYPSAVAHYRQALQLQPSLADDPDFIASLRDAQRQNALALSNSLLTSDQPEQAVSALEAGLRDLPADPALLAAIAGARHTAADSLHRRAQTAADRAQLDLARTHLEKALQYQSQHAPSLAALQSLTNPSSLSPALQQAHAAARQAMSARRWQDAADQLNSIIAQSPDYLPARADALATRQQITLLEAHLAAAQRASTARQLDSAISELKLALQIWPDHPAALALLNDVVARRTRATELADAAADALAQKQYDQSIASAQASLALFPAFSDAARLNALARQAAADHAVAAGIAARDNGDFPAANAAFSKAMSYQPQMPAAQTGLASVATAQADAAMAAGNVGLSLLFRMQAADQSPTPANRRAVDAVRQTLIAKGAFALMIDGRNPNAQVAADTAPFANELISLLRRQAPATVAINPTPLPADRPVFSASVAVVRSQVTQAMTSQQQLSQQFAVPVRVPNDQIPALRDQFRRAADEYDRLKDRTDKRADLLRDYKKKHDPASPDYAKAVSDLERSLNEARRDSDNARRNINSAKAQLDDAPRFVVAEQIQHWPFIRQRFTQTASVIATLTLTDGQNRALVAPISITRDLIAEDDTTLQPNPAIGVPEDPLVLPSPDAMQRQAISESAQQAAAKLLDAAIRARAANLQSQADALRQADNAQQAMELDIAAALVIEPLDPQAAARRLAELRTAAMK